MQIKYRSSYFIVIFVFIIIYLLFIYLLIFRCCCFKLRYFCYFLVIFVFLLLIIYFIIFLMEKFIFFIFINGKIQIYYLYFVFLLLSLFFSRKLKLINIFYVIILFFYQYALIKILPRQNRVLTIFQKLYFSPLTHYPLNIIVKPPPLLSYPTYHFS